MAIICQMLCVNLCNAENKKVGYSLDECIKMVLRFSPELQEKRYDIAIAKTREDEAVSYQYFQLDSVALLSLVPNARGDQMNSPDNKNVIRGLGLFEGFDATVVQPLYTFDKITSGKKAAQAGILVEKSKFRQKGTDLVLRTKKYYNGYLLASDIRKLVSEVRKEITKAKKTIKKKLKEQDEEDEGSSDSADVDPVDLDKLEAYEGMADKFYFEAEKSEILAKEALMAFMGLSSGQVFALADKKINISKIVLKSLERYVEISKERRPEFHQLREGLKARKHLVTVAEADKFPMIFLGGNVSIANADGRTDNENPFIYDPLNHIWGGVALGAKWHFDFGVTQAKVDRARAEYLKLKQTKKYAQIGIPLQVKKAYFELKEAMNNVKSFEKSYKAAKRWLVTAVLNFDIGFGDAREIFEALKIYSTTRGQNLQSIYNYNVAVANLQHASGEDVTEVTTNIR